MYLNKSCQGIQTACNQVGTLQELLHSAGTHDVRVSTLALMCVALSNKVSRNDPPLECRRRRASHVTSCFLNLKSVGCAQF
jgi:hypothetical protein